MKTLATELHYLINNCHKKRDQWLWKIGNWRAQGSVPDSHLFLLYTHKNREWTNSIFNLAVLTFVPTFGVVRISLVKFRFLFMIIFAFPPPISCMIRHLLCIACVYMCTLLQQDKYTFTQDNLLCSHDTLVKQVCARGESQIDRFGQNKKKVRRSGHLSTFQHFVQVCSFFFFLSKIQGCQWVEDTCKQRWQITRIKLDFSVA